MEIFVIWFFLKQVIAKVVDKIIKEICKIFSLFLWELFDSIMNVVPIFPVDDNVNKLIHDVVMSYLIWNQELEFFNWSLLYWLWVRDEISDFISSLLKALFLNRVLLNHISILLRFNYYSKI